MQIRLTAHADWGLSWVAAEPAVMRRGSAALADGAGGVWLVDPVDGEGLAERLEEMGAVRGVVQLVDRHPRNCAALAERYRVPHVALPHEGVPALEAESIVLRDRPWWREVALWLPERRTLLVGETVGTAPYFRVGGARLGIHPFARLGPPKALAGLGPEHLLPGHGEAVSGDDVGEELDRAIAHSRRDIPGSLRAMAGARRAT